MSETAWILFVLVLMVLRLTTLVHSWKKDPDNEEQLVWTGRTDRNHLSSWGWILSAVFAGSLLGLAIADLS